jgi:parvulin-like peptidyl-prolyl isomerase
MISHVAPAAEPAALARVGDTEVKIEEVRSIFDGLDADTRATLARDPKLLNQTVRSLLVQRLVLLRAMAKGWDSRPEVVAKIEMSRQSTIVDSYLDSVAEPAASYPTEAEARTAYESSKAALLVPRQYRLAQIFLSLPPDADKTAAEKVRAKIDGIRKKLQQRDADFGAVARAESEEKASAAQDGEIGWLTEAQIQPEIRPRVLSLAKGGVSEPVILGDGWHLLKMLEIKEPYTPTFEAVRAQLVRQLRAERAKAARQDYVAGLLKESPIAINELALSELIPATDRPAPTAAAEPTPARQPQPRFK